MNKLKSKLFSTYFVLLYNLEETKSNLQNDRALIDIDYG